MNNYIALCMIIIVAIGFMRFGFYISFKQSVMYIMVLTFVCTIIVGICILLKQAYWYSLPEVEQLSKENKLSITIEPVQHRNCPKNSKTDHYHLYIRNLNTDDHNRICIPGPRTIVTMNELLDL